MSKKIKNELLNFGLASFLVRLGGGIIFYYLTTSDAPHSINGTRICFCLPMLIFVCFLSFLCCIIPFFISPCMSCFWLFIQISMTIILIFKIAKTGHIYASFFMFALYVISIFIELIIGLYTAPNDSSDSD